jgi:5'-3' exonuclease
MPALPGLSGDMYSKITIASPDKDLLQIADTWFYDYSKRTTIFCNETVSLHKFCHQLITGDSTDNIPGCFEQELLQLLLK